MAREVHDCLWQLFGRPVDAAEDATVVAEEVADAAASLRVETWAESWNDGRGLFVDSFFRCREEVFQFIGGYHYCPVK